MEPWEAELLESARRDAARRKREADTPIYFEAYAAMREKMWAGMFARVEGKDSKREAAIARAQKENEEHYREDSKD